MLLIIIAIVIIIIVIVYITTASVQTETMNFSKPIYITKSYTPANVTPSYRTSTMPKGKGQKIAIICAYKYTNIANDFKIFCAKHGFSKNTLTVYNLGSITNSGWNIECALDTQWARVMAPEADIIVVNAKSASIADMDNAVKYAVNLKPNIVSMSWGASESTSIIKMEKYFSNSNIIFLAASGDYFEVSYPATSPNVIAVGGSRLYIDTDNRRNGETDWASPDGIGTGHGISAHFTKPSYQLANSSYYRTTPDISCIAANSVEIYCGKWLGVQGTSLSCPLLSGLIASANSGRTTLLTRHQILSSLYNLQSVNTWPINTMSDGIGFVNERFIPYLISL